MNNENLIVAVLQFNEFTDMQTQSGLDYRFPAGGETQFLTSAESALFDALNHSQLSDAEKIRLLSEHRDPENGYPIVILGCRLAVFAVRTEDAETYRLGVLPLTAGVSKIDWRDGLTAFSVFEDCANRLGISFQAEVERVVALGFEEQLQLAFKGFFPRSPEMRDGKALGVRAVGEAKDLRYERIRW